MTKRQKDIWRIKMLKLEWAIICYYRTNPIEEPDDVNGSFAMSAFKAGYWLAKREAAKEPNT